MGTDVNTQHSAVPECKVSTVTSGTKVDPRSPVTGRPKPSNTVVSPSSSPPGAFLQSLAARSKEKRLYSQASVDSTAKKTVDSTRVVCFALAINARRGQM